MASTAQMKLHTIPVEADGLVFTFTGGGDIRDIRYRDLMLNQIVSNPVDGSMNNIYLRVKDEGAIRVVPLIGLRSNGRMSVADNRVIWEGEALGIGYKVAFILMPGHLWFWDVRLSGADATVDVIYGQDLGLADQGAVRTNEAYMSQYAGHTVVRDEAWGYIVCSRQNQPMSTGFPYMQQGSLTGAAGFSTDGFQFFGLSYKETDVPEALTREHLANEVYQYEFAYTALQSGTVRLNGDASFVFYGMLKPDHKETVERAEYGNEIRSAWEKAQSRASAGGTPVAERSAPHDRLGPPLRGASLTEGEADVRFPARHREERDGGMLLSFFTKTYEHVVLKEKELRSERPHGHILMSGGNARMTEQVITSTNYMYGIFHSQISIGNTSFNKMMTNARNALNVPKTSGQRVYVERNGKYRLLTMPSAYEIGFNYARWHYKLDSDMLTITAWSMADRPELALEASSELGIRYRFMVTNQIAMNDKEYEVPYRMERIGADLLFRADTAANSGAACPGLGYRLSVSGAAMAVRDESALATNVPEGSASLVVLEFEPCNWWRLTVRGSLNEADAAIRPQERAMTADVEQYRSFLREAMNGFALEHEDADKNDELQKFNALAWWYTHNMLVHYSVPHGLEQYSGAAWGTRDVCQGPAEYFMATGKFGQVKEILTTVYSHQYEDDGNWPQWFMFDRYYRIQQEESHGDIIVWPLKVLGDYLRMTGDYAVLREQIPYSTREGNMTEQTYSLLHHARKEIQYIKDHFLHGTFLSSYGDGDWDDTLQPANAKLKRYMVSSWTVALTYQVFRQLSDALAGQEPYLGLASELGDIARGIEADFGRFMLADGVIPGFLYMEDIEHVERMLHPSDSKTGIRYRLLPMTRGMIGELLDGSQAEAHYELIKRELYHPDGVRLMNRPAQYAGGVSTRFKRAEQAANFGREIGLQYVHAHIRFVEAMAKLGKADEVWRGLRVINPVGIRDVVTNAEWRQSNAYFSSSDGKFANRYAAQEGFDKLRSGEVAVKGGWRIYSSGPGIYMNQLISSFLGIRREAGDLVIDPVLPPELDGLSFRFRWMEREVRFRYAIGGSAVRRVSVNGQEVGAAEVPNRYRHGGVRIGWPELESRLQSGLNEICIEMGT